MVTKKTSEVARLLLLLLFLLLTHVFKGLPQCSKLLQALLDNGVRPLSNLRLLVVLCAQCAFNRLGNHRMRTHRSTRVTPSLPDQRLLTSFTITLTSSVTNAVYSTRGARKEHEKSQIVQTFSISLSPPFVPPLKSIACRYTTMHRALAKVDTPQKTAEQHHTRLPTQRRCNHTSSPKASSMAYNATTVSTVCK